MKLSEMTTDQLATCLCVMSEPAERIMQDENVVAAVKRAVLRDENGRVKDVSMLRLMTGLIPVLLGAHRADTFLILGAMNGKSAEEISLQNGRETIADIKACFDTELLGFFTSLGSMAQKKS